MLSKWEDPSAICLLGVIDQDHALADSPSCDPYLARGIVRANYINELSESQTEEISMLLVMHAAVFTDEPQRHDLNQDRRWHPMRDR